MFKVLEVYNRQKMVTIENMMCSGSHVITSLPFGVIIESSWQQTWEGYGALVPYHL